MKQLLNLKSIQSRLIITGLLICTIALGIAFQISYTLARSIVEDETKRQLQEQATNYAGKVNEIFKNQEIILEEMAANIAINGNYKQEYLRNYLYTKYTHNKSFVLDYYIGLADPDSVFIAASNWTPPEQYNYTKRSWYFMALSSENVIYIDPYVDSNTNQIVVSMSRRIVADGVVTGVIAANVLVNNIHDIITRASNSMNGYVFLADGNYNFITHPKNEVTPNRFIYYNMRDFMDGKYLPVIFLRNISDSVEIKDYDEKTRLFIKQHIEAPNWNLIYAIDRNQYLKPLNSLLEGFILTFIISILGAAIVLIFMVKSLTRPLKMLNDAVTDFSAKNFAVRSQVDSQDEIGVLSKQFNHMADIIENYSSEMERLVRERTKELELRNRDIMESMEYAKLIQESILRDFSQFKKYYQEHFLVWEPRDGVGGDFYWLKEQDNLFAFAVIDCTGHGVPGALMCMTVNSILDRISSVRGLNNPALILQDLNKLLRETLHQDLDTSITDDGAEIGLCVVNKQFGQLIYAGAGMPLIAYMDNVLGEIKGDRQKIGYKKSDPQFVYENYRISLKPESVFYITTDGFLDQNNETSPVAFGKKRFREIIVNNATQHLSEQKEVFIKELKKYQGAAKQRDDITLLAIKI